MKKKVLFVVVLAILLIVIFYPRPQVIGGLGGVPLSPSTTAYKEEYRCFGLKYNYLPESCVDCVQRYLCFGITYDKECFIQSLIDQKPTECRPKVDAPPTKGKGIRIEEKVDTSVPSSFSLLVRQTVKILNSNDTSIKLESIDINTGSVDITVSSPGGCGLNADPRCLGPPGFSQSHTVLEGNSVDSNSGFRITIVSIDSDSVEFRVELASR